METYIGSNNWALTVRRGAEGVTILRAATCDARAALPDELFGLPVVALGDRALAPGAAEVPGERLRTAGAPCEGEWDNRALRELTLPASLRAAGDYALMNCRALQTLRLTDRPVAWGAGALMNCRALSTILIDRAGGEAGGAAAYFSLELNRELDLAILEGGRTAARLVLPEYYEEYEENGPAHHFDYKLHGAGQPYHQVFRGKTLDYSGYDALWPWFLTCEHEPETALRLAWWRVCCPEGLSAGAEARYRAYLAAHAGEALAFVLTLRDTALLRRLLDCVDCDAAALRDAAALARERSDTAAVALLMDELHRRGGAARSFAL